MKPRIVVVFYLMVTFVFYLGYNLVEVQARRAPWLTERAMAEHIGTTPEPALRGAILDRNGQTLAASLTLPSIACTPHELRARGFDLDMTSVELSKIVGVPQKEVRELLNAPGFVWLARKVPESVATEIGKLNKDPDLNKQKFPGIFVLREPTGKRFYPKGRLAVHILGYTGIDDNGLDGIEAVFDPALKGKPGTLEAEMDRDGRVIPDGWSKRTPARQGNNVVLTIDESIQYLAESELQKAWDKFKPESAQCIVMDVKTGDILALANKPDYATRDASKVDVSLRRDRAISDTYEPGSTMKVLTAAAALDSGKITPKDTFLAGPTITVDGWTIHNADDGETGFGAMADITDIITHSLNVGTTSVALKMGKKTMFNYMMKFGIGHQTGICLPGEAEGLVQPYKDWANITLATNSYGQGVTVTPLQMVNVMQTIANDGVQMKPRLVKEIQTPDGRVVKRYPPVVRRRVISHKTAQEMREILRNVVLRGTGKLADIPGYPVAGKTGTANIVEHGVYVNGKYVASFLGFTPYNDPRIVCMVKVTDPKGPLHWGGSVAGPVFKTVCGESLWKLGVQPQPIQAAEVDANGKPIKANAALDAKGKPIKASPAAGAKASPASKVGTGSEKTAASPSPAASASRKPRVTYAPSPAATTSKKAQ